MTLPKRMELQWQREVIEKILDRPGIPLDARTGLLDTLKDVNEEMARLGARAAILTSSRTGRRASRGGHAFTPATPTRD